MIVQVSFDDGASTDLKIADLMMKYDVKPVFYWPSMLGKHKNMGKAKSWLSLNECKELSKNFEIGSHSMTHQFLNKLDISTMSNEITGSRKFWQDQTGQAIESFAYPKNSLSNLTKVLIKGAGYKKARTSTTGLLTPGDDAFAINCTLQIAINRLEYKNKSWVLFSQEMMSKITENSVFHLFGNSWEVEEYNEWDRLEDLLKQLKGF